MSADLNAIRIPDVPWVRCDSDPLGDVGIGTPCPTDRWPQVWPRPTEPGVGRASLCAGRQDVDASSTSSTPELTGTMGGSTWLQPTAVKQRLEGAIHFVSRIPDVQA